ncbi:MAG: hypothetical protein M3Y52_01625 [Actinomycetota bacterium]|nr:hypothetical protein [Actinomycetota bacterium]
MNTPWRRTILWILNALGAFVGVWALFWPRGFHDAFPGLGFGAWASEGPFNEHFVRDVGALYLALVAAGIFAALARGADAAIAVGIAWIVFSVPHLVYHLGHLHGLAPVDAIAQPIALALTLVLAIPLVLPPRDAGGSVETVGARPVAGTTGEESHR